MMTPNHPTAISDALTKAGFATHLVLAREEFRRLLARNKDNPAACAMAFRKWLLKQDRKMLDAVLADWGADLVAPTVRVSAHERSFPAQGLASVGVAPAIVAAQRPSYSSPTSSPPTKRPLGVPAKIGVRSGRDTMIFFTVIPGKDIRKVHIHELDTYMKSGIKQAWICSAIRKHAGPAALNKSQTVGDVINDKTLRGIISTGEAEATKSA